MEKNILQNEVENPNNPPLVDDVLEWRDNLFSKPKKPQTVPTEEIAPKKTGAFLFHPSQSQNLKPKHEILKPVLKEIDTMSKEEAKKIIDEALKIQDKQKRLEKLQEILISAVEDSVLEDLAFKALKVEAE